MKQVDKLYHFVLGAVIFWVASYFINCPIIPIIVIAIGKEVYDLKGKHSRMCIWDILATISGGLIVWVVM